MSAPGDKAARLAELEAFFAPYQRDLSHFGFDRVQAHVLVTQSVLSLQGLNEAANVMRRKLGFAIPAIRIPLNLWGENLVNHPAVKGGALWWMKPQVWVDQPKP